jgi:hypothetical protein
MKFNKLFVEELKQKLTFGNTRSILLNATPGRLATRLSLADITQTDEDFPKNFLESLTTKNKFSLNIKISFEKDTEEEKQLVAKIAKRIEAIYFLS